MTLCETCEKTDAETFCPSCHESYCKSCFDFTHQSKSKQDHKSMCTSVQNSNHWTCSTHGKKIDSICEECEEFVCFECCIRSGSHVGHKICQLSQSKDAVEKIKNKRLGEMKKLYEKRDLSNKNLRNEKSLLMTRLTSVQKDSIELAKSMCGLTEKLEKKETWGLITDLLSNPDYRAWLNNDEYELIKHSFESKFDIAQPQGILLEILLNRKAIPKKVIELATDKSMIIQAFHAEAQLDLFGKIYYCQQLKKVMKTPRSQEDYVGLAVVHFCLEEYEFAYKLFSKFDHIPFVQCYLGRMYEKGHFVELLENQAFLWYQKSASTYFEAKAHLSLCYMKGLGVRKDVKEGIKCLQAAVNDGFVRAIHDLAVCYYTGSGVPESREEAFELFKKAALLGVAKSQFKLGYCYEKGLGVTKNENEAFRWYTTSAQTNFRDAQCNVGYCYENGIGCVKNEQLAVEFYEKSALQGYPLAQYNMGVCFLNGVGVFQDLGKAKFWLKKAADLGYEHAKKQLEHLQ